MTSRTVRPHGGPLDGMTFEEPASGLAQVRQVDQRGQLLQRPQ
ncbi:MAG TPA: hypothetical protein VIR33_11655 [Thermopolyspora sp.]